MIKLDKLVMQGFKSFQRKTAIPLFEGFNVVVGPNASGKSNILDGLCFVLGRSSKTLRAGRMDQIIYNGAHGSKPADHAIVNLHITNDGTIPNQPNEIIISRKVNRQGISVYKLNGKGVTREKILDVLRYVHIDPDGHNIIQQGQVTSIIEMKPKERREVIDEIAGIKEYKDKKEKSLKELEKAQRNIDDATIVLDQKKDFLKKIKKERDIAVKHQDLQNEMQRLKANIAFTKLKGVESTLENVSNNLEIKEAELKNLNEKIQNFDKTVEEKEATIKRHEKQLFSKTIDPKVRKEIEDLNSRIIKRQGQINSNHREIERLDEMIENLVKLKQSRGESIISNAVKRILKTEDVRGTIANLGKVDSKFERAIDIATGGHLNDVIVDSEKKAIEGIKYLKENNLSRVRFLPLDRLKIFPPSEKAVKASKSPGIIDFAINLIKFDKKYEKAFQYVFRDSLVAENIDAAKKIKGIKIITLDGDLFEAGGAIVGGKARQKAEMSDVIDIKEYENAKDKLQKDIERFKQEIAELESLLKEKRNLEEKDTVDLKKIDKEREILSAEIDEMKRGKKGEYEQRLNLEAEVNNLKLQRARLEAEYDNLMIDYEPFKDRQDLVKVDIEKTDRDIEKVEKKLRAFGLINMKSIEEFDIFNKDYDESKQKLEQLYAERNSIKGMIEKLEEKRKEAFTITFSELSKEFSQVFSDFVGGEANLSLENENDIESGLIIKAQPKDKKLLSIDAMSGGEKALTAIAFIFAILRHKAAPFYILDEIDAMLDKENAEKLGDIVQKYSKKAQFLVITHNDITARRAERVYGITMQKGVSQILGMELKNN